MRLNHDLHLKVAVRTQVIYIRYILQYLHKSVCSGVDSLNVFVLDIDGNARGADLHILRESKLDDEGRHSDKYTSL